MSAINDALRRASGGAAQPSAPPPALLAPTPSDPALDAAPIGRAPAGRTLLLAAVLGGLLVCAIAFHFWNRHSQARQAKQNTPRPILATHSAALKNGSASPLPANSAADSTTLPANTAAAANKTAGINAAVPAVPAVSDSAPAAAPVAPRQFPPLRLQSIFYRPGNPLVMINGKMCGVNDQVQGVTIAAIDMSSVTLVLSGRTNVLTLR